MPGSEGDFFFLQDFIFINMKQANLNNKKKLVYYRGVGEFWRKAVLIYF